MLRDGRLSKPGAKLGTVATMHAPVVAHTPASLAQDASFAELDGQQCGLVLVDYHSRHLSVRQHRLRTRGCRRFRRLTNLFEVSFCKDSQRLRYI